MHPKAIIALTAVVALAIGFALPGRHIDSNASARTLVPALHIGN